MTSGNPTLSRVIRNERLLLWVIALFGAARVLFFSTAFPLFSNTDEFSHFDAVYKYSRGELPNPDRLKHDTRASILIVWLGSPEYMLRLPEPSENSPASPPWAAAPETAKLRLQEGVRRLTGLKNHELAQPPVYYAVAGGWYRLAEELGLACGHLVFSIRWLNALFMVGLIWAAHRLARATGRCDPLTRIGAPLLIAFLPQDAFYSISNDALSPLVTALALLAILRMYDGPPRLSIAVLAGFLAALAVLTKYTNCIVLVPSLALAGMHGLNRDCSWREGLRRNVPFWLVALAPIVAWGAHNASLFGDPTAMRLILESQGYRPKPLGLLLDHPLFSPHGLTYFFDSLGRDFWRGRFMWHGDFLAYRWADVVYVMTSGLLLTGATAAIALGIHRWYGSRKLSEFSSLRADLAAWLVVASGIGLLAVLSLRFEFPVRVPIPSRDDPYFTNARLISGSIAPFALLYVRGLGFATGWIHARGRAIVRVGILAVVLATIAISEISLSTPAMRSKYNWFRLEYGEDGACAVTPPWRIGASSASDAPTSPSAGESRSPEAGSRDAAQRRTR